MQLKNLAIILLLISCHSDVGLSKIGSYSKNEARPLLRINFIMYSGEAKLSPSLVESFNKAVEKWASLINIEAVIYTQDTNVYNPFTPAGPLDELLPIKIRFQDLQGPELNLAPDIVGIYQHEKKTLFLDADSLCLDNKAAYRVALHELGHVFGLPHIVASNSLVSRSGILIAPDGIDPKGFIMYPEYEAAYRDYPITGVEIELANEYIRFMSMMPGTTQTCLLTKN